MRPRNKIDRHTRDSRAKIRKNRPSPEICEPRMLMASGAGFIQGYALTNTGNPLSGASVTLYDSTGTTELATTSTNSAGYYNFDNPIQVFNGYTSLIAGTTYEVTESATGYTTSVASGDIQTTIDKATANGNAIKVTVGALPQSISLQYTSDPYTVVNAAYKLNADPPYNQAGQDAYTSPNGIGGFDLTLTGNAGNIHAIVSDCSDLLDDIYGPPSTTYTVSVGLTPNTTTLTANLGELGYLYNTYGTPFNPPSPTVPLPTGAPSYGTPSTNDSIYGAGLQLAMWALEYNQSPVASLTSPNSPFAVNLSLTDSRIVAAANAYLSDAHGNSEDVYFLNIPSPVNGSSGGQGMLSTDLLNFTNTQNTIQNVLTITTSQQPASATVGTPIADQATVTASNGDTPTGTVTFTLYDNPNGTGTPLFTDAESLVNGVATSANYTATTAGTDYWVATYNGDDGTVSSGTGDEPVNVDTINTSQQPASASVGSSIADKATVTGLVSPSSSDTVTFNLYSSATTQDSSTLLFSDTETVSISGSTATATSAGYTATATGTDYWVATFNGDSSNAAVTSGATAEPVNIDTINTSQQPASASVGSSIADKATVTGLVSPSSSDTVTFNLYSSATTQDSSTLLFSDTETVSISGSTATATSAGYTATATGTDYWVATFNGDSSNAAVTSGTTDEPVNVDTINTSQQPASASVGSSIADKATVTGLVSPSSSDTVTFNLYSSATTQDSSTLLFSDTETVSISGSTATATSAGYTATATGTDYWVATFNGDSSNAAVTSGTTDEPVNVDTINTSQQPASASVGSSIADKATVTGLVSPSSSDTVTFNLYSSATTQDSSTLLFSDTETVSISGSTATATSAGYTATATGTDYWVATFNGDSSNAAVTSGTGDEPVNVDTINTSQQPASASVGSSIADKATVTGLVSPSSSDTVTFNLYSSATTQDSSTLLFSDTETVSISGSTATATSAGYTATATGTDYWVATFNGDSSNAAVTSGTGDEPVNVDTINTSQQPASASVGSSIADKATVTGLVSPSSSDTVTFNLYSSATTQDSSTLLFSDTETVSISGSTATATSAGYTATATGTDYWVATFNGDSSNAAVTSGTAAEPVNVDTINTSQQPASASVGSSIADKATVTGLVSPSSSDTVTFNLYSSATTQDSSTLLFSDTETVSISGSTATATSAGYTATATGTDYWVATFNGDSSNAAVTSGTTAEPVNIDTINTSQQPASASVGSSIADKATVTGLVSPSSSDTVTFNLYSSATTQNSSTLLYSNTQTVSINGSTATATSAGYTATATGTDYWVATFNGDSSNAAVTSGATAEPVNVDTINTSQQPASASVGSSIADKATVTGLVSPSSSDTVTFNLYSSATTQDSSTLLFSDTETVSISGSTATATSAGYTATATGTDYWVATFNGDSSNAAVTSGTTAEPVNIDTINTSQQPASASVGSSIADKATVTGLVSPSSSDTVTFNLYSSATTQDSSTLLFSDTETVSISGSTATATSAGYTATATGTDYWVATFNGDSSNAAVTSGATAEPVNIDTINTSQQPASASVGSSIADKATVTGLVSPSSSDTVTFNLYSSATVQNSSTLLYSNTQTVSINGSTATATSAGYTATATGTDYWVATFNGDSSNAAVTSGATAEPVNIDTINTSQQPASASVGSSIADKATVTGLVSPSSSDTVTFNLYSSATVQNSSTLLYSNTQTVSINGSTATATSAGYTATATGTDYWVATFNGDSSNAAVTSGATAEPVNIDTINTSQQPASASVGSSIADKATVTGLVSPSSSDTVTFNLYSSATVQNSSTLLYSNTQTVSINGSTATATSAGYTATATGTDYWVATFNGDSSNAAVTSGATAEPVNIDTINTSQQPASASVGSSIADKATVTGLVSPSSSDTVTFNLYSSATVQNSSTLLYSNTQTVSINGSTATATSAGYTATATGTDYWVATFNGDSNNAKVTSGATAEPVTISPSAPSLNTTPGGPVTLGTFTISGTKYLDMTGSGFSPTRTASAA